jgi:hypothetical protein
VEDEEIKLGFLMEAAQTHQQLAERALEKLERHTRGLDDIVRQEIRRTLIEELRAVHEESERAANALRRVRRALEAHRVWWSVVLPALSAALATLIVWFVVSHRM